MSMAVNINGVVSDSENAKISVLDRGFLYGDSIYEVTQVYGKNIFMSAEHLDRLWLSAARLGIKIQLTRDQVEEEILKTVYSLKNQERIYVRIIITRGEANPISLDPNASGKNNFIIIAKPLAPNPKEWYTAGVHMIVARDVVRNPKNSVDPSVKSGNYLNNVMAFAEANERNAFDAIMLNHKGHVTEATTSNIWIVKNKTFITPPLTAGILGGITRGKLLDICAQNQLNFEESLFNAEQLKQADECFLTSSTKFLIPITKIDETDIGAGTPGNMTAKLSKLYMIFVKSQY